MTCLDRWHQFHAAPGVNPAQPCPSCMTRVGTARLQPAVDALFELEATA
jgi:hypothetical protein